MIKHLFGLIGYPLSHSFSKRYFSEKFQRESIINSAYELFEIKTIHELSEVLKQPNLRGLNVTIPYKQQVMQYVDTLDPVAERIGGASKAVVCVLQDLSIDYSYVSRRTSERAISYADLKQKNLQDFLLIINTTPLGMSPNTETYPDLDYQQLTSKHFCYDLVYNPEETAFMKLAREQGTQVKYGLEMLHLQAEKSWEFWNRDE